MRAEVEAAERGCCGGGGVGEPPMGTLADCTFSLPHPSSQGLRASGQGVSPSASPILTKALVDGQAEMSWHILKSRHWLHPVPPKPHALKDKNQHVFLLLPLSPPTGNR